VKIFFVLKILCFKFPKIGKDFVCLFVFNEASERENNEKKDKKVFKKRSTKHTIKIEIDKKQRKKFKDKKKFFFFFKEARF
jgi:hypothetical protein